MSLPPPENSSTSHGPPAGQPSVSNCVRRWRCSTPSMKRTSSPALARFRIGTPSRLSRRGMMPPLNKERRIVEPRVPLGEHLERLEPGGRSPRRAAPSFRCALRRALRCGAPRAAPLHDFHRVLVFAQPAFTLGALLLLEALAFFTDGGRGRRRAGQAHAAVHASAAARVPARGLRQGLPARRPSAPCSAALRAYRQPLPCACSGRLSSRPALNGISASLPSSLPRFQRKAFNSASRAGSSFGMILPTFARQPRSNFCGATMCLMSRALLAHIGQSLAPPPCASIPAR